jgi:endoglucanase
MANLQFQNRGVKAIGLSLIGSLTGCTLVDFFRPPANIPPPPPPPTPVATPAPPGKPQSSNPPTASNSPDTQELLNASWAAYKQRFIQGDGRSIDREADDRSTSGGQAYTLLRALFIDDPNTFAQTLEWGEKNLRRKTLRVGKDTLWVWKWGKQPANKWGPIDPNFATDADIDAAFALILASRKWNKPEYLTLAKTKLQDIWALSTEEVSGRRYLLPGPKAAFVSPQGLLTLNPSYLAPYAFRLFAQVDPDRDWMMLVDSSYQVLEESAKLSQVGLPSDWVAFDRNTRVFQPVSDNNTIQSKYAFDAYRVWWRVFWDAAWYNAPEAKNFLHAHLQHPMQLWRTQQRIPAEFDLKGQPLVDGEATSQYAMLYAALRFVDPAMAQDIRQQKLMTQYRQGFWDNDAAYYTQNIVWLGLLPPTVLDPQLLEAGWGKQ